MLALDRALHLLGLQDSNLARWEARNDDPVLQILGQFYLDCPGLIDGEIEAAALHGNYGCGELRRKIVGFEQLDRTQSFVGGFPWTDEQHPWPQSQEGEWLSPLLQLNMAHWETSLIGLPNDVLVQVWGNFIYPVARAIPLADLGKAGRDDAFKPFANPHLSYQFAGTDWGRDEPAPTDPLAYEGRQFAELTKPDGDWQFFYPCDLLHDPYLAMDRVLDDSRTELSEALLENLIQQIQDIPKSRVSKRRPPRGWRHAFGLYGGYAFTRQVGFDFDGLNVLTPEKSTQDYGLNILYDGSMTIQFLSNEETEKFTAHADR